MFIKNHEKLLAVSALISAKAEIETIWRKGNRLNSEHAVRRSSYDEAKPNGSMGDCIESGKSEHMDRLGKKGPGNFAVSADDVRRRLFFSLKDIFQKFSIESQNRIHMP